MKLYKDAQNIIFAYEEDGSQDHLIGDKTPITQEEFNAIQQARLDSLTYAEKRARAYPSIVDQLDTLFHGGYDAWKAEIQAIKDKFPKPTDEELA